MAGAENASAIRQRWAMLLIKISDVVQAASNMTVHKQQFAELGSFVDRMKPILLELNNQNVHNSSESLKVALRDLETCMEEALKLLHDSKWLFMLRPDVFKKVQDITHRIAVSLDNTGLASLSLSLSTKQKTAELCEAMKKKEFKAAVDTEEVIARLQEAFREQHVNSEENLQLMLELIAKLTGAPVDSSFVIREWEETINAKAELEEDKRHNEAHILEQVIAVLPRLDRRASSRRWDYSRGSIDMKSLCCRITGELMEDPVDTTSTYTFERRAIEAWFEKGNKTCPVTNEPLASFELYPNRSIAATIKEWKERNVNKRLEQAALDLYSHDQHTAKESLSELCELFNIPGRADVEGLAERLVKRLVELPRVFDETCIRVQAMQCLSILAQSSSENKVLITGEGGVDLAVDCLNYEIAEVRTQGMTALLDLSEDSRLCGCIGEAGNCIPRLIELTSMPDTRLSKMAEQILENLAGITENLTRMMHANYLKPLMRRITQGSKDDKVSMAMLLRSTELTDDNISTLVQQGILPFLVQMLSETTPDPSLDALTALQVLSRHPDAKEALLSTTNVVSAALELLRNRQAPGCRYGEIAAKLLADLVLHRRSAETHVHDADLAVLTEKENIQDLVALIAIADTLYPTKGNLLQILLGVVSMKTESGTKEVMRNARAIQTFLSLCDEHKLAVRLPTLILLSILTEDGNGQCVVDSLEETHVKNFVVALSSRSEVEEKTAVSGILLNISVHDYPRILNTLLSTDTLRTVLGLLSTTLPSTENNRLIENALGLLLLFTSSLPPSDRVLRTLTEFETISILVSILDSGKTGLAKQRAATGLAQLSRNTMLLSGLPATQTRWTNFLRCCKQSNADACAVHGRTCSAKDSFCLVEADAVVPLTKTLGETECCADEAALAALDTLLGSETFQPGINAIEQAGGLIPVKLLLTRGSPKAKLSVLPILEKVTVYEKFVELIGPAEVHELVRFMQVYGDPIRQIAARILANTGKIDEESKFFV